MELRLQALFENHKQHGIEIHDSRRLTKEVHWAYNVLEEVQEEFDPDEREEFVAELTSRLFGEGDVRLVMQQCFCIDLYQLIPDDAVLLYFTALGLQGYLLEPERRESTAIVFLLPTYLYLVQAHQKGSTTAVYALKDLSMLVLKLRYLYRANVNMRKGDEEDACDCGYDCNKY